MRKFQKKLLNWHDQNPRELSWKNDHDVYSIWISEIIMQQTRVSFGETYYQSFKDKFPTVFDLSEADLDDVMKQWEGLGYYSRARNIHQTARFVVNELDGQFPTNYDGLLKLKGIGPYTAAAIASFAYNQPVAAIDGNAYRVMARYFGIDEAIDSSQGKKTFFNLGQELIQSVSVRAGDYNQSMMNFGATVCTPKSPKCMDCCLNETCFAQSNNKVQSLPVKKKKRMMKTRYFLFFICQVGHEILIEERVGKDVWQNLFQFPMIEHDGTEDWPVIIEKKDIGDKDDFVIEKVEEEKQSLTHQHLFGHLLYLRLNTKTDVNLAGEWVLKNELSNYPFPKMLQNAVKSLT